MVKISLIDSNKIAPSTLQIAEEISKVTNLNLTCFDTNSDQGWGEEDEEEMYCDLYELDDVSEVILIIDIKTHKFDFVYDSMSILPVVDGNYLKLDDHYYEYSDMLKVTDKGISLLTADNINNLINEEE